MMNSYSAYRGWVKPKECKSFWAWLYYTWYEGHGVNGFRLFGFEWY